MCLWAGLSRTEPHLLIFTGSSWSLAAGSSEQCSQGHLTLTQKGLASCPGQEPQLTWPTTLWLFASRWEELFERELAVIFTSSDL